MMMSLLGAVALAYIYTPSPLLAPEPYRSFDQPDGSYTVVVLRNPMLLALPGQSGDAPGMVQLIDRDGAILNQVPVEMVQLVDQVTWSDTTVSIRLIADWTLPN